MNILGGDAYKLDYKGKTNNIALLEIVLRSMLKFSVNEWAVLQIILVAHVGEDGFMKPTIDLIYTYMNCTFHY